VTGGAEHGAILPPYNKDMATPRTLEWIGDRDGFLRLLDQTLLPTEIAFRDCRTVEEVW